jgi:hypothetical protein
MTDNQLIKLFLPIVQAGLIADGFLNVTVKQSNQPTQQGINSSPTVYFYKVGSKRYGFLGRFYNWDAVHSVMVHNEKQYMEATFQISALVRQFPITPNQYTAADLVTEVSDIMQSDATLDILNNAGVGILRVTEIRNPYFTDDHDQFEASPSFDFTLTYQNDRVMNTPVIQLPIAFDIKGV